VSGENGRATIRESEICWRSESESVKKGLKLRKRGRSSLSNRFGLSEKNTTKALEDLLNKADDLQKKYDDLSAKHTTQVESLEMIGIRQQRERVDEAISDIRDWYGLHVLERLHEESRTLKWLTVILIALTFVLAIFTGFLVSGIRFP